MAKCSVFNDVSYKFEDFILKQSLWSACEENIKNISERSLLKEIIGDSIVDETVELHKEISTLYEIWKEHHDQLHKNVRENVLPEPPLMRENMEKQISLLVQLLQDKIANQRGRLVTISLTDDERRMIKNITRNGDRGSSDDVTLPSDYSSRCSSSQSVCFEGLQENINIVDIDQIVQPLREEFEMERKTLLSDIDHIQTAIILENEMQYCKQQTNSPTLTDLRRLSSKLEKEVLSDDASYHTSIAPSESRIYKTSKKNAGVSPLRFTNGHEAKHASEQITKKTLSSPSKEDCRELLVEREHHLAGKRLGPTPPKGERTVYKPSSINLSKLRKHINTKEVSTV